LVEITLRQHRIISTMIPDQQDICQSSFSFAESCQRQDSGLSASPSDTPCDIKFRRFKEALGLTDHPVEASVVQFLLELCSGDVGAAVAYYRAQEDEVAGVQENNKSKISVSGLTKPSACSSEKHHRLSLAPAREGLRFTRGAQSCRILTASRSSAMSFRLPRRSRTFEPTTRQSLLPPRITKNVDMAEAPRVTTPFEQKFSRCHTLPCPVTNEPLRDHKQRRYSRCQSAPSPTNAITTTTTSIRMSFRRRGLSSSQLLHRSNSERSDHSSCRELSQKDECTVSCPPTARKIPMSRIGRNLNGRNLTKTDPSAQAA